MDLEIGSFLRNSVAERKHKKMRIGMQNDMGAMHIMVVKVLLVLGMFTALTIPEIVNNSFCKSLMFCRHFVNHGRVCS